MPAIFKNGDRAFSYLYLTVFVINCFFMYFKLLFYIIRYKKRENTDFAEHI